MNMNTHSREEPRLVAAAQSGDAAAFSTLVASYYERIYHLTVQITRNAEDAEDASQEAMTKAYCKLKQFQGDACFGTWLTRIAMNEALMTLRKRSSMRCVALDEVEEERGPVAVQDVRDNPESRLSSLELRENLNAALKGLTPPLRTTFKLKEMEELSVKETAAKLGASVSAVKSRLKRARSTLRRRLRRYAAKEISR
jgi:RNA polymerase sigma-70 factor, ECF subfamily